MPKRRRIRLLPSLLIVLSFSQLHAETNYKLLNAIAACTTVSCVRSKQAAAHGHVEQSVLYAKWMMLEPTARAAARGLLENIPTSNPEMIEFMTISDWHDGATTSTQEMAKLDAIYTRWPQLLAVAVRRLPAFLPAYIRYGRLAVEDPHFDYTGYEQKVCIADKILFVRAFLSLSLEDREYIQQHVFKPELCKPVFLSEGEGP